MPLSNPTAIFAHGFWPLTRANPLLSVYTQGWFGGEDVEALRERVFRLLLSPTPRFALRATLAQRAILGAVVRSLHNLSTVVENPVRSALAHERFSVLQLTKVHEFTNRIRQRAETIHAIKQDLAQEYVIQLLREARVKSSTSPTQQTSLASLSNKSVKITDKASFLVGP